MLPSAFSLLLLAACGGATPGDTAADTGSGASWSMLAEGESAAFLSIWGSSSADVWIVGADAGTGPAVAHYDGTAWSRVDTGSTGGLWWVTGTDSDARWMGGEGGRVLRHTPGTGVTEEWVLDPALTVFGVWGASDSDVWAVGGNVNVSTDGAGVWHWDGTSWTAATLPSEGASAGAVYKVWGRAADDVYAVGTAGLGLHWDGSTWSTVSTGTSRNLFTVSGSATEEIAVGGEFSGTIVSGAGSWTDRTPTMAPQFNGVYAGGAQPVAVGMTGAVYLRGADGWTPHPFGAVTALDLHAVWMDEAGGIWTVGGKLSSYPLDQGIVAYAGDSAVPAL